MKVMVSHDYMITPLQDRWGRFHPKRTAVNTSRLVTWSRRGRRGRGDALALQAGLKSNGEMELVTIGEAAQTLGLNTSALRYYEDRGLVKPARRGGKRMYTREQLCRLAFIQLMQRLGIRLDAAAAVLDEPSDHWRDVVREQIAAIDDLIARA